jgi:hypothetical protein
MVQTGVWWGNKGERDYVEDVSADWTMVLERISNKSAEQGVYWIDMAQVQTGGELL